MSKVGVISCDLADLEDHPTDKKSNMIEIENVDITQPIVEKKLEP